MNRLDIYKLEFATRKASDKTAPRPYSEADLDRALQRISGSLFRVNADLTHPLAYGMTKPTAAAFRRSATFIKPLNTPYGTPFSSM